MTKIRKSQYRLRLKRNMEKLNTALESGNYPNLANVLNAYGGSLYKKLSALHSYFIDYGNRQGQTLSYDSYRGWEMMLSYDTMVTLGAGRDKATWEAAINKLCALEMLKRYRPRNGDNGYNSIIQQTSADRAAAAGRKPVTWYSVPEYNTKLLKKAEGNAPVVKMGCAVNKDAIRDAWGADRANRITDTGYSIHDGTKARRKALKMALEAKLTAWGYTCKQELIQEAMDITGSTESLYRWVETWNAYKPLLFKEMGLKESRPTKAEKAKFNTTSDSWIIRKV